MLDGNLQTVLGTSQPLLHADPGLAHKRRHFCSDIEGWGPLSPFRYDLTPCFLDLSVSLVGTFGVFLGAWAFWFLLKRRAPQPVPKNWHFYAKLVSIYADDPDNRSFC